MGQYIFDIFFCGQAYNSHVTFLKTTLISVIKFIFKILKIKNDEFVYSLLNLLSIKNLYYKNVLIYF